VADTRAELGELWPILVGVHRMLLRLAGQVPDEWLAHIRDLLGGPDLVQLPDTVTFGVAEMGVPLTRDEVEVVRRVKRMFSPEEPFRLPDVSLGGGPAPVDGYRFAPVPPEARAMAGKRIPDALDLTGGGPEDLTALPADLVYLTDVDYLLTDDHDDSAVSTLTFDQGTVGVWRAWRFGPDGADSGRRVYLVEVGPEVAAWRAENRARRVLVERGDRFPQVEVYWTGDELMPYHRALRDHSTLLWAPTADRVRFAPVDDGNGFDPRHPRVTDPAQRDRLLAALRAGVLVEGTDAGAVDVVDPGRGAVVPQSYRTDGVWAWSDATAYYLAEYGLAPDAEFAAHLWSAGPADPSTVDSVARFRAELAVRQAAGSGTAASDAREDGSGAAGRAYQH
jgi:hypothetical protein